MQQQLRNPFSAAMAMHGSIVFSFSATLWRPSPYSIFFYSHNWLLEALNFLKISPNLALYIYLSPNWRLSPPKINPDCHFLRYLSRWWDSCPLTKPPLCCPMVCPVGWFRLVCSYHPNLHTIPQSSATVNHGWCRGQ